MAKPSRECVLPPIRCNSEELRQIKENAAASPLSSLSAYVRDIALNGAVIQRDSVGDKRLLMALARVGNNLNQLSRRANIHGEFDPSMTEQLGEALHQLQHVMEALIE